jgi:hypothetical protein
MRLRTVGIWLTTMTVCTLGSAAIATIPLWGVASRNDYLPGNEADYVGIIFGFVGFLASLVLSPLAVKSDQRIRDHRKMMEVQQIQPHSNALSLLRAAECPPTQARVELLRPARSGSTTAPEHLLRAVGIDESEG